MKILLLTLLVLLTGCGSSGSSEVIETTETITETIYVDRDIIKYVDRNITEIQYVDKNVTVYVDRPVHLTEYVYTEVEVIKYIDRNITEYVDRNITEYVDRNITIIEYVDRNITEYIDRNITIIEYVEVEVPVEAELKTCELQTYDSVLKVRIVYEDGTPYKRGAIKAQGSTWISQGITDDDGKGEIEVQGDERFIFSAFSPYGDYVFYDYITPIVVPMYETELAYSCEYNEEIVSCYETEAIN